MDEDVVSADLLDHVDRLPAGVDQVVLVAVHRLDPERDAEALGVFRRRRERAGDVVVFGFGRWHAGPFADAAIGDAGQGLGAHLLGHVHCVDQMLDRTIRVDRGPVLLR